MPHGAGHGRARLQRRVPCSDSRWNAPRRPGASAASVVAPTGHRYLQEAAGLSAPLPAVEPTVAVTQAAGQHRIRAYARHSGLSLGQVVAQAVTAFLDSFRQRRG